MFLFILLVLITLPINTITYVNFSVGTTQNNKLLYFICYVNIAFICTCLINNEI